MKQYKGINYRFKPDSYWIDKTIRQSILRDIKGAALREGPQPNAGDGNHSFSRNFSEDMDSSAIIMKGLCQQKSNGY